MVVRDNLQAICDSDASIARVTCRGTQATIEVRDASGKLVFDAVCENATPPIGVGWFGDGNRLLCVFEDGKILEYCKIRRRFTILLQVASRLTACSISEAGIVASTDDSWILFIKVDGTKPSGWVLNSNVGGHHHRVVQLIGPTALGWYYAFSTQKLCCFCIVQPERMSTRNISDLIVASASSSGRYVSILTQQGLKVFTSNLQKKIFSVDVDHAISWKMHWHTDAFLILLNAQTHRILLLRPEDTAPELVNVVSDKYNIIENMLTWRMGAFLLQRKPVMHGKDALNRFHKVHSSELLQWCAGLQPNSNNERISERSTDLLLGSAASVALSNAGSFHEFDASISSRSYSMKRRVKLAHVLLLSRKPYSAFKICPDSLKGKFISSGIARMLLTMSPSKSIQVPLSWVHEVPVMRAHVQHAVDEPGDDSVFDFVLNTVANACCKVDFLMRFDKVERVLSLVASLHDEDEVYKVVRAYASPADNRTFHCRYNLSSMVALRHYSRHVRGTNASLQAELHAIQHIVTSSSDFRVKSGDKRYKLKGRLEFVSTRLNILDSYRISCLKRCSPVEDILRLHRAGTLTKGELFSLLSSFGVSEHCATCTHFENIASSQLPLNSDASVSFKSSRDVTRMISELTDAYAIK